ncbi:MAG TPA: hypothetical protein VF559_12325 [Caulobacteraceae bacterium]|jgi:hypothetical protein
MNVKSKYMLRSIYLKLATLIVASVLGLRLSQAQQKPPIFVPAPSIKPANSQLAAINHAKLFKSMCIDTDASPARAYDAFFKAGFIDAPPAMTAKFGLPSGLTKDTKATYKTVGDQMLVALVSRTKISPTVQDVESIHCILMLGGRISTSPNVIAEQLNLEAPPIAAGEFRVSFSNKGGGRKVIVPGTSEFLLAIKNGQFRSISYTNKTLPTFSFMKTINLKSSER